MHNYVPKTVQLTRIRMLQCTTDPQMDFQSIIIHHDPVGELAEHHCVGGVHLFSAVDMLLECIHPVFHLREFSCRYFEFSLPLLQKKKRLISGVDPPVINHFLLLYPYFHPKTGL